MLVNSTFGLMIDRILEGVVVTYVHNLKLHKSVANKFTGTVILNKHMQQSCPFCTDFFYILKHMQEEG